MLRIRLSRTGKKKQASYRVVVTDIEMKRDGRIVERIGHYNPLPDPIEYLIQEDRALYWLSVGAQPSDAVRRLLDKQGTFDRLARLRAGEELAALVAEYQGVPLEETTDAAEEAVAEEAVAEEAVAEEAVAEEAVAEEAVAEEAAAEPVAEEEVVAETAVVEDEAVAAAVVEEAAAAAEEEE